MVQNEQYAQSTGYSEAKAVGPGPMGQVENALAELEKVMATLEQAASSVIRPRPPENEKAPAVSEMKQPGSPVAEQAYHFANRIKRVCDQAASICRRFDL